MNNEATETTVKTIEALTLHSLDRTGPGLDELAEESRACARGLGASPEEGIRQLGELAEKLHGFDVFRGDVLSVFQIDPGIIRDARGDLGECGRRLRSLLDRIPELLERGALGELAALLSADLPEVLGRYRDLVPALRGYIAREYAPGA